MGQASQRPLMIKVWIGLLALTLVEVVLAYVQLRQTLMLTLLMGFSLVKAAMIMGYFMHLKFDRPALTWLLVPALVSMVVVMLAYLLPDGYLLLENRP
jgi:caa(3)-type oxidase subunit IV